MNVEQGGYRIVADDDHKWTNVDIHREYRWLIVDIRYGC